MRLSARVHDVGGPARVTLDDEDGNTVLAVSDLVDDPEALGRQVCALWNLTVDPYPITVSTRDGVTEIKCPPRPDLPPAWLSFTVINYDEPNPVVLGGEG